MGDPDWYDARSLAGQAVVLDWFWLVFGKIVIASTALMDRRRSPPPPRMPKCRQPPH